jgi:hypothetical protein
VRDMFRQWVYGEYQPVLDVTSRFDAATMVASLTVRQTQTRGQMEGFTFPLTIEYSNRTTRERVTVNINARSVTQEIPLMFVPETVVVDPEEASYLAVTCSASRPCRTNYTCVALSADEETICVPPRT